MLTSVALLLAQGAAVGRESTTLAAEWIRIVLGRSDVAPAPADARFADLAWRENPAYRRLAQANLAWCRAAEHLVESLEDTDWAHAQTARFVTDLVTSAVAPTNLVPANPAAVKRVSDTGGTSLAQSLVNWLADLRNNGGLPSMVPKGALKESTSPSLPGL